VAHPAAELQDVPLTNLSEDAAAFGTGQPRLDADGRRADDGAFQRARGFFVLLERRLHSGAGFGRGHADQMDEQRRQIHGLDAVIDGHARHRVGRHAGAHGVRRILHHGNAAGPFHRLQASRPVVERPAGDHADDA